MKLKKLTAATMKERIVLLLFLCVFSFALCGCQTRKSIKPEESNTSYQSSYETTQSSYETASTDSSTVSNDNGNEYDIYISSGEPYKQGVFTKKEYYSEWINLYCDIPSNMRLDNSLIETIKELNKIYSKSGQIREMMALNSDETVEVDIYTISLSDNETFEQYIKKHYQEIRDLSEKGSVNGIQMSDSGDNFSTYSFLGEDYLLNTRQTETRYNGKLSRALIFWDLFRMKGDHVIQIQCRANQNSGVELEDLLSMFTTYDSHFNTNN